MLSSSIRNKEKFWTQFSLSRDSSYPFIPLILLLFCVLSSPLSQRSLFSPNSWTLHKSKDLCKVICKVHVWMILPRYLLIWHCEDEKFLNGGFFYRQREGRWDFHIQLQIYQTIEQSILKLFSLTITTTSLLKLKTYCTSMFRFKELLKQFYLRGYFTDHVWVSFRSSDHERIFKWKILVSQVIVWAEGKK